jgi:hypothetical protein
MAIHFVLQVISFALIAHVFRTDERFEAKGSHLGEFIHSDQLASPLFLFSVDEVIP